uniref:Uncharacterized protein n=1 Tax=virus sp. ctJLD79 TaxID=2827987 RepID=A0A8S5RE79_9VIRU|nr:MAG TPA: hypothetical protein [virus sp. ctJLD79]
MRCGEYLTRWDTFLACHHVFDLFSECSAGSVAAFKRQFYTLWQPLLRPRSKGAGKVKSSVTATNSFPCPSA